MRKQYKKLTKEQIERKVIFSSQLLPNGNLHEVFITDEDKNQRIERLKDDRFFNESNFKINEIRR